MVHSHSYVVVKFAPLLPQTTISSSSFTNNNFVELIHGTASSVFIPTATFDALSSTTIGEHLFWKGEEDHTLLLCYFLLFFAFTIRRIRFISTHRANSFPHLYHRQFVPCPIVHIAVTAAKQSLPSIVTSLVTVHPFLPPGNI